MDASGSTASSSRNPSASISHASEHLLKPADARFPPTKSVGPASTTPAAARHSAIGKAKANSPIALPEKQLPNRTASAPPSILHADGRTYASASASDALPCRVPATYKCHPTERSKKTHFNPSRRSRKGARKGWKKLLWVKQAYPDNYTDTETFLDHLQRNPRFRPYDFWPLIADFTVVVQHLCSVIIFLCCFTGIFQERIAPITVVGWGTFGTIIGWVLWDSWVSKEQEKAAKAEWQMFRHRMNLRTQTARAQAQARQTASSEQEQQRKQCKPPTDQVEGLGLQMPPQKPSTNPITKPVENISENNTVNVFNTDGTILKDESNSACSRQLTVSAERLSVDERARSISPAISASVSSLDAHNAKGFLGRADDCDRSSVKPLRASSSSSSNNASSGLQSERNSLSSIAPSSPKRTSLLPFFTRSLVSARNRQRAKSALLLSCFLLGLSPILESLTKSTTSDSIWAMSCWLLIINIYSFDYGSPSPESTQTHAAMIKTTTATATPFTTTVGDRSAAAAARFPASLSTNAALMASTVLASRLASTTDVFSLTLFSIEVFGLFPIFRRCLRAISFYGHVALTIVLIEATGVAVWVTMSRSGLTTSVVLSGMIVAGTGTALVMGICSWWLISLQKYKNVVIGPWDPARPVLRRRWDS